MLQAPSGTPLFVQSVAGCVIEQIMLFGLGFLIAGMLALAFVPVFWHRALRLTRARLERQLPLTPEEIQADRDFLRAEAALQQRRLEQKFDAANEAHIGDMVEIGRREWRIGHLVTELDQQSGLARERLNEINRLSGLLQGSEAEAASLLQRFEAIRFLCEEQATALQKLQEERDQFLREKEDKSLALVNCLKALAELHERHRALLDRMEAQGGGRAGGQGGGDKAPRSFEDDLAEARVRDGRPPSQEAMLLRQEIRKVGAEMVGLMREAHEDERKRPDQTKTKR